jgi:cell wall assembly regulator SMI1
MDRMSEKIAVLSRRRRQMVKAIALLGLAPAWARARGLAAGPLADLDVWLTRHLPEVAADLNPGATDAQLDRLSAKIGAPLPDDFRALYKWHDGQKDQKVNTGPWYGLTFLSLDRVLDQWKSWASVIDHSSDPESMNESSVSVKPGVVKRLYANKLWIPFAYDWGGNHLGIDLDPDVNGIRGQVINFGRDEDRKRAIAPNVTGFVQWLVGQLQAGNFLIEKEDDGGHSFNTLNPPSTHFLDAIQTLFKEPGEREPGVAPPAPVLHCPVDEA